MTTDEISKTLASVGMQIVSTDTEKIVGKFEKTTMIFVYYKNNKVVEKPVIQIDKEHNMPVLGTGREFYYTDENTLVNLVLSLRK